MSKKNFKDAYFQHDRYARQDSKIKSMLMHFRKISEEKALAACCIFWWIIEDMHIDDYPVDKLDVFADDYRCDVSFLKSILEDFGLFRIENNCYISDRVLKNLKEQEEKSEKAKKSAARRWNNSGAKPSNPAPEAAAETDEKLVDLIISDFKDKFKKSQVVSKENMEKISNISKKNNLTLEVWQKIFDNAKRGWNINGENKKPNLKNILDNWDLFASDDYNLAPDTSAQNAKKERQKSQNEQAQKVIAEDYFSLDNKLVLYDEYRVLSDYNRLKAIEFYVAHKESIPKMLDYIKKELTG